MSSGMVNSRSRERNESNGKTRQQNDAFYPLESRKQALGVLAAFARGGTTGRQAVPDRACTSALRVGARQLIRDTVAWFGDGEAPAHTTPAGHSPRRAKGTRWFSLRPLLPSG
jgi:hypothetical protein